MDFTGIIAEYDPFHNGHAAQLAAVRAAGAQCIAVCMSSGAVQRGGVPILPESVRVRAALDAGADLVVALPAPYACATAEQFAAAGVHLLAALGCDTLAFGAETPDAAALLDTARLLDGEELNARIRQNLATGMTYAAARAVAEKPAEHYNPLFIYGDSGLGKTHLLYAIAHQVRQRQPEARIVYIKGDDFTNELIASIREGKNAEFREKYRQSTLLLVDDIQFIAGKKQTQEEFFHTFNTLYESGRQIVLTSDRPPREMTQLEDRLQTRFEWGLMVDVAPPDFETRLAIIKNKAALLGVQLPDDISSFIAENLTANVRQIEGALNKLLAYRDLLGNQVDGEAVSRAVKDMLKKYNEFVPSPSLIIEYICRYYDVDEEQVRGQGRKRDLMEARQTAMYLIRRMTNLSLNDIGKEFGDRDHTTVLHSLDQVEKKMRSDPAYAEKVKEITTNINNKK